MVSNSDHTPTRRRVLITGAGSGSGAAIALALAPTHDLMLVGRRIDRLEQTAEHARLVDATVTVQAHDVSTGDPDALLEAVGPVDDLVLAAGLNTPRREWRDQSRGEFHAVVATNLFGVADVIAAALPGLRESAGQVVVISSRAAWVTSPGAGVAYRASKSALRSVTESLNEQESEYGVRACHLCPGDIDTDFLDQRPSPPPAEKRREMLSAADVARAVLFVLTSPPHVRIDELAISPVGQ